MVVVISEVHSTVMLPRVPGIADVARLRDPCHPGLYAVFFRRGAASVGSYDGDIKSGVDELGHAPLRPSVFVLTFIHCTMAARSPKSQYDHKAWKTHDLVRSFS